MKPAHAALLIASILFLVSATAQTDAVGTWHEELSVHAQRGGRVIEVDPASSELRMRRRCESGAERVERSPTRPRLSLCLGSLALPVMIDSYFTGFLYWPFALLWDAHEGDAQRLRKIGLVFGVIGLVALFVFVRRLRDDETAAMVVMVTAVSSPYVFTHAFLVYFEVLPWLSLAGAGICLLPLTRPPTRQRIATAGVFIAVGMLANVKTVFLLAPLVVLVVLRHRAWLARLDRVGIALASFFVLAACSPYAIFFAVDPGGDFGRQITARGETLVSRLDPRLIGGEIANMLTYGTDVSAHIGEPDGLAHPLLIALAAVGAIWALIHLARWVARREADRLGVLCGALLISYFAVGLLLYDQQPRANYAPLHTIFGMTWGGALAAAVRTFRPTPSWLPATVWLVAAAALLTFLHARSERAADLALPMNAPAQDELRERLGTLPRGSTVIETTYNMTGLVASLSGDRLDPVTAHHPLGQCLRTPERLEPCLEARLAAILDLTGPNVYVLLPARTTMIDEAGVAHLSPTLSAVAGARGWTVRPVTMAMTANGVPVFRLVLVVDG